MTFSAVPWVDKVHLRRSRSVKTRRGRHRKRRWEAPDRPRLALGNVMLLFMSYLLGLITFLSFYPQELEAMSRYTSPVNPAVFPHLTVVLLAIGMFFTAWFFVYPFTADR
ncbi:unnamed protein product [Ranitomeya imitator]|uniref:Dolichyl-diphosphooligosaccharide-protein glycosyltransferase subunit TMEM258 n=1 Tax=Ranitomeya imitator TaxID=111125 RepID=A0ABN9KRR2_9NEOB|nr:unnamed protein product [Ranitomeya imitator]